MLSKVNLPMLLVVAVVFVGAASVAWNMFKSSGTGTRVAVTVPVLSDVAAQGKQLFDAKCATCHGVNASGSDSGPPLVHRIYEPNHHSDISFHRAVRTGVRSHHWPYGNMAPVAGLTDKNIDEIVRYVRELQLANGIF